MRSLDVPMIIQVSQVGPKAASQAVLGVFSRARNKESLAVSHTHVFRVCVSLYARACVLETWLHARVLCCSAAPASRRSMSGAYDPSESQFANAWIKTDVSPQLGTILRCISCGDVVEGI